MTWTQHESGEWLKKTGRYLVPCSCVEHYYCLCQCCDWECKKCSTLRNVTSIRFKKMISTLQLVNSECTEWYRMGSSVLKSVPDRESAQEGVHDEEFRVEGSALWRSKCAQIHFYSNMTHYGFSLLGLGWRIAQNEGPLLAIRCYAGCRIKCSALRSFKSAPHVP